MGAGVKYFVLLFAIVLNVQAGKFDEFRNDPDFDVCFHRSGIKVSKDDRIINEYGYPDKSLPCPHSVPGLELFLTRYNEVCRGKFKLNVAIDIGPNRGSSRALWEDDFVSILPWINQQVIGVYAKKIRGLKVSLPRDFSNEVRLWAVQSLLGVRDGRAQRNWPATEGRVEFVAAENGKERRASFKSGMLSGDGPLVLDTVHVEGGFMTPDLARGIAGILSRTTSHDIALRFFHNDLSSDFFGILEKSLYLRKITELKIKNCGLTDRHLQPYRDEKRNKTLYHLLRNLSENCRVLELSGWDRDALPLPADYQEKCVEFLHEDLHQEGVDELLPVENMLWMLVEFNKIEYLFLSSKDLDSTELELLADVLKVMPELKNIVPFD